LSNKSSKSAINFSRNNNEQPGKRAVTGRNVLRRTLLTTERQNTLRYSDYVLFRTNRRQFEHSTMVGCLGNIATAQSRPHRVELARVIGRKIRRPSGIVFDQIDSDLGGILAFMDEHF
jgi:hypothetical protein